jgi:hypothetical protein
MYVGKTLFAQVMEFVPWTSLARIVHRYRGNVGVRALSCAEQFRAMAFAQLTWRESLRDIEVSLSANTPKLYAMGFRAGVKRSTLADANESRDRRIWFELATLLIRRARKLYVSEALGVELDNTVYTLHQAGAFFVTRAKSPMDARRVYSAPVDRDAGVICDQRVMLNGYYSAKRYPEHLRRIRFKDPESGKTLVFLTNNTGLPALTICALYKSRWQVELFFKWIKQHLRIKKFLGTSENAVKTQVWCGRGHLRAHRHRQKGASPGCLALHMSTYLVGLGLRENPAFMRPAAR